MVAGIAASALSGIVSLIWLTFDSHTAVNMLGIVVLGPFLCGLVAILMIPGLFFQSFVLGAPGVSIIYATSFMKRNWRGIGGGFLLTSAAFAWVYGAYQIH